VALVEIKMSDGESVWMETDDASVGPPLLNVHVDRDGAPVAARAVAELDFQQVLGPIKGLARDLSAAMGALDRGPDSYEVTLGVKITADAGVVFAKAGGEASLSVKLSWQGQKKPAAGA
jgi:hypothetical protein